MARNKDTRKYLAKYLQDNSWRAQGTVIKELVKNGYTRSLVFRVAKMVKENQPLERKRGSGGHNKSLTPKKEMDIVRRVNGQVGISNYALAVEFKCSEPTIRRVLKRHGIQTRKRKIVPKTDKQQKKKIKTRCRKLIDGLFKDADLVLDDEAYFGLERDKMGTNAYVKSNDFSQVSPSKLCYEKAKYGAKRCVHITVSERGVSAPFYNPAKSAINQHVYELAIKQRVIPFMRRYHAGRKVVFWPDGASCHYAAKITKLLDERGVLYVPRDQNPPNVPQLRPVEPFWNLLKNKVYAGDRKYADFNVLEEAIKKEVLKFRKIWSKTGAQLFGGLKKKIREMGRKGADEFNKSRFLKSKN